MKVGIVVVVFGGTINYWHQLILICILTVMVFFEDRAHVSSRCCRVYSRLLTFEPIRVLMWSCQIYGALAVDSG